jgi:hypothetical protein
VDENFLYVIKGARSAAASRLDRPARRACGLSGPDPPRAGPPPHQAGHCDDIESHAVKKARASCDATVSNGTRPQSLRAI